MVSLPPVVKTGVEEYAAHDAAIPFSLVRRARIAVLVDVVSRWKPDVLLVDHSPHGMKGELLPVFESMRKDSPRTKVVLGLRDILDEPSHVRSVWEAEGIFDTLERVYDRILVYGQREIMDPVDAYGMSRSMQESVTYCGYVTPPPPVVASIPPGAEERGYVLGTVGGGGDGVDVLVATLEAASRLGLKAVLSRGPLMPMADIAALESAVARVPGTYMVDLLNDVAAVAKGAACVVTRGGYNSLCELTPLGTPTVVVPRTWPRSEQLLRAQAFAARGLLSMVHPDELEIPGRLSAQIEAAMQAKETSAYSVGLDLRGVERLRKVIVEVADHRRFIRTSRHEASPNGSLGEHARGAVL